MLEEKQKDKFMLDIKRILENQKEIEKRLKAKDPNINLDELVTLYKQSCQQQNQVDDLKAAINHLSKEIGVKKRANQSTETLMQEVNKLKQKHQDLHEQLLESRNRYKKILESLPNIPADDVPLDLDPNNNVCIKTVGQKQTFDFTPKSHLELSKQHELFDFETGAKISGTGWTIYKGMGARLEWALLNLMIDTHIENGFTFHLVPHVVKSSTMYASGQLPKFKDQAYKIPDESEDHYLIPTSEVPLNGLHMDEILDPDTLPRLYCAYSPCFRKEAGAAGKQERGLIRTHQFNKVELFALTTEENNQEVFNKILKSAESVLEKLELHYRNMLLVSADSSFAGAKTIDVEVFLPTQNRYYEVSSVTNCTDFQARRSKIRYKAKGQKQTQYVHTINGSALATSRLMVALLENNQKEDGSIAIPKVLQPYLKSSILSAKKA